VIARESVVETRARMWVVCNQNEAVSLRQGMQCNTNAHVTQWKLWIESSGTASWLLLGTVMFTDFSSG
jgi:hypothetical protein